MTDNFSHTQENQKDTVPVIPVFCLGLEDSHWGGVSPVRRSTVTVRVLPLYLYRNLVETRPREREVCSPLNTRSSLSYKQQTTPNLQIGEVSSTTLN